MKLLVVSHSCAEPSNQRLFSEIQAIRDWEVSLIVPANWHDEFGNILDKPPHPGLMQRTEKVPVFGNGKIILHVYLKAWEKFLRNNQFDAIYVNHEPYALATAQVCQANLRLPKKAAFGFYSCQNIFKRYPLPFRWLERKVYRSSQFAFPITPAVAEVLREKGFTRDVTVAPLPFDPAHYFQRGGAANETLVPRQARETVIGFVGRIVDEKGLRTLAAALVSLSDLQWKLVVIGTGSFEQEFRSLLSAGGVLDRCVFQGFVPHEETPRFLSAFDFLVLPSETQANWKEQFGRVITESLACGRPVIGSDSGEIPNLIRLSGGGLIFPEKNIVELAKAMRLMIITPSLRKECAMAGDSWVNQNVSLRAVAGRMASTIERATGRCAN